MWTKVLRLLTVAGAALATPIVHHPASINETIRMPSANSVSSCWNQWMPIDDVTIGGGTEKRTGVKTAVKKFCSMVDGMTVNSRTFLSMATEIYIGYGKNPSDFGGMGYLYFEIHNKLLGDDHHVRWDDCEHYLENVYGGGCYGSGNHDTRGGTYQVGHDEVSYHIMGFETPPEQDAINKLFPSPNVELTPQNVNKGDAPALNPWPLDSLNDVKPIPCHSHNDYDKKIPLFNALSAGCTSVEADVWLSNDVVLLGHDNAISGITLRGQYVDPLRAIIEHNGGCVFKSRPDQTLVLLLEFKETEAGLLDAVNGQLQPLREAGYLSTVEDGKFVKKAVTVVASGKAPFDRLRTGDGVPGHDIFYDAPLAFNDECYTPTNSYVASGDFNILVGGSGWSRDGALNQDKEDVVIALLNRAHAKGQIVRYWNVPEEPPLWASLTDLGVNLIDFKDLRTSVNLKRL